MLSYEAEAASYSGRACATPRGEAVQRKYGPRLRSHLRPYAPFGAGSPGGGSSPRACQGAALSPQAARAWCYAPFGATPFIAPRLEWRQRERLRCGQRKRENQPQLVFHPIGQGRLTTCPTWRSAGSRRRNRASPSRSSHSGDASWRSPALPLGRAIILALRPCT